ncbi:hypothetical protein ERJ75_001598400 [Trypanosoma vivax]|uniref:CHCH domain-containing protein n=1 Tax=Trypanosoma vivax (strain Y486) TaxID=1055687 RepID=G0TSI4_TRYVY|nr:hypothetical protein ERJ75_001598400 [Trypanosoma vivax]CCC46911.1 conserved hypothetical protein [Trypanosoma vivax Y486]
MAEGRLGADAGGNLVLRLPQYFPLTVAKCEDPTNQFFTCFEQHAVMKDPTDTLTAKNSLMFCQSELRGYMACMEDFRNAKEAKPFWKRW